ncbi:MAG: hypothetical protein AB7U20_00090 [Planctomycetaceae bacterium]
MSSPWRIAAQLTGVTADALTLAMGDPAGNAYCFTLPEETPESRHCG